MVTVMATEATVMGVTAMDMVMEDTDMVGMAMDMVMEAMDMGDMVMGMVMAATDMDMGTGMVTAGMVTTRGQPSKRLRSPIS